MERLRESLAAFRDVAANRPMRRLQLAYVGSATLYWAAAVGMGVYAFQRGGATALGVRVMVLADVLRVALALVMAATVAATAPLAIVFALSSLNGIVGTAFQPAKSALMPSLARGPQELTAANVVTTSIESTSMFVGPALGGLLLAATSFQVVMVCVAGGFAWSAALLIGVRPAAPAEPTERAAHDLLGDAREGLHVVARDPALRLLFTLIGAQLFVDGLLGVFVVAVALDLLDLGQAGVGYLNAALGLGGLAGVVVSASLVGMRRLAPSFALGNLLWGAPIALIAAVPEPAFALVMMGLIGVGNTFVDVSGVTLLQRAAPEEALGRVFGLLEAFLRGSGDLGGVVAPALIDGLGIEGALVAGGAVLPALVVLRWAALRHLDDAVAPEVPVRELALLRAVPMFSPLRSFSLEQLASSLQAVSVPAGHDVFAQGDRGDRFYIVADGTVEISVDGRLVQVAEAGDWFGEIALLRDVPRTGTARARTDTELRALDR